MFRDVALSTQGSLRAALAVPEQLRLLDLPMALSDAECAEGDRDDFCALFGSGAQRTTVYRDCRSSTPSGHTLLRKGSVIRSVEACDSTADPRQIELVGFEFEERSADEVVASLKADVTIAITELGRQGCAGPDVEQRIDGTIEASCTAEAESSFCGAGESSLKLTAVGLVLERISFGDPCQQVVTARGGLEVVDALSGEQFREVFQGLTINRRPVQDGSGVEELRLEGQMSVGCLGTIRLATDSSSPIIVAPGSSCPSGGTISLGRPAESRSPASVSASVLPRGPGAPDDDGLLHSLHRAANGQVYQVIRNEDAANGADAIQITSLVGTLRNSIAFCGMSEGQNADPMAVAVAAGGTAFPIESVFRSAIIDHVSQVVFNRNAEDGAGRVCVGADCTADGGCPEDGACETFTLADGTRLSESENEGRLVEVQTTCGSFPNRETYAFGSGGPTIESALCDPAPDDGIHLGLGKTLIVAYDTLPLDLFNAAVAGLPIDTDGSTSFPCPGPGVLSPGRVDSDTAPAPKVDFEEQGVGVDYDGDDVPDRFFKDCDVPVRIDCKEPKNPTPTPTVDPSRPCGAKVLGDLPIDEMGTTIDRTSTADGSSCGWGGGNGAADRVYEYVAEDFGIHDFEVEATGFTPHLYVREGDCESSREELGCAEDGNDDGRASLNVELLEGQRVAIVVDGADDQQGTFRLRGKRRQPDLAVQSGSLVLDPETADAGDEIEVSVTIENRGDGDAGPFSVDFFLAEDANGMRIVSVGPLRCTVAGGLPAQQSAPCVPDNEFNLPLLAPRQYFLLAGADGRAEIAESDEFNNAAAVPFTLGPSAGVLLEQLVLRAGDGTLYQLIQALPQIRSTVADSYRVTTLAASLTSVSRCEIAGSVPGSRVVAAVGSTAPFDLHGIKRTDILRPNTFGEPLFDLDAGGRLTLGTGDGAIVVCDRPGTCDSVELSSLDEPGMGIRSACETTLQAGAECTGTSAAAFARVDGQCGGNRVTPESEICNAAPADGFELRPGESVVFVYAPGREPFELGVGAFGIAAAGSEAICPGVVEAKPLRDALPRAPLLSLVGAQQGAEAQLIALSPDGRHAYLTGDGFLRALRRSSETGLLDPVQELRQGLGGVRGLDEPVFIAVSADGRHVYVVAGGVITIFGRDADDGTLILVQVQRGIVSEFPGHRSVAFTRDGLHAYVARNEVTDRIDILVRDELSGTLSFLESNEEVAGGFALEVSPDGSQLYVEGDGGLTVLERDAQSGALSLGQQLAGASLVAPPSPDNRHVYVVRAGIVSVFARNEESGQLDFVADVNIPEGVFIRLARFSPDGRHFYGASRDVSLFSRDVENGNLTFLEAFGGVFPESFLEAQSMEISPDGRHLYLTSSGDLALSVLGRDVNDGRLTVIDVEGGVGGQLAATVEVALSPDGRHAYSTSFFDEAVVVSARDAETGRLTFVEAERGNVDGVVGLFEPCPVVVSPDGRHVYVGDRTLRTLLVFARNPETGELRFIEIHRQTNPPGTPRPIPGTNDVTGLDPMIWLALSPDGRHLYVSGGAVFSRDVESGRLTFVDAASFVATKISVSPDGRHAYIVEFELLVATRDSDTGKLRIDGFPQVPNTFGVLSAAVSHDGKHVYATYQSTEGGNSIVVFERNIDSGGLTLIDRIETVEEPGFATVDPNGRFVYVVAEGIAVFARDASTGRLALIEVQNEGLSLAPNSVAVSPDGQHVYAPQPFGIAAYELTE